MTPGSSAMHVARITSRYVSKSGEERRYESVLLRRTFRQDGKVRHETLANLTRLPAEVTALVDAALKGATLVGAQDAFETERSVPHGDVAAAHVMASKLGLAALLGPAGPERDIAYALVLSRAVRPESKLSTVAWWAGEDTTLGTDLGVAGASTGQAYAAMDWLVSRQGDIQRQLAGRRLREGGVAMFDLSSSWVEGSCCELAAFGYSRDGKRGRRQAGYGLLTDPEGRPVAVEVFAGNTSDPESFKTAITRVRDDFGISDLIMVGDRGMITSTRIEDLRKLPGMQWVTALRAPAIAKLASDDGPLQMSLFDAQNFAEITHPNYPGERLVCCLNPFLAADRARKREALLAATGKDLAKIRAAAGAGRLEDPDKIGIRAGKVIGKHKVGKHFLLDIAPGRFAWRRDEQAIAAEAALDGIYVIRTSVKHDILGPASVITAYKNGALREVFPEATEGRCWFHKQANVLAALPKSAHPGATKAMAEIWNAEDKDHARTAVKAFEAAYGAKYPKAVAKITDDLDQLLAFFDFPADHWVHLRTTNPIESTFATVRHRTKVTKGHGSRAWRWRSSSWNPPRPAGARSTRRISSPWSAPGPPSSTASSSNDPRRKPSQKRPKNLDPQVLTITPPPPPWRCPG